MSSILSIALLSLSPIVASIDLVD